MTSTPSGSIPLRKKIEVAAAVIRRESDGAYLITKRLKESHLGHLWEFPGGKLELGESVFDCVQRECKEEIDVEIKPIETLHVEEHDYPEVALVIHFVASKLISGTPHPIHCEAIEWALPNELKKFNFPEADLRLIERLEQEL